MSESLIARIGRLVSGSFNQIVTAAENAAPETVMAEAIRQVEDAIDEVRAELGKIKAQKHNATQRLSQENDRHEGLSEKIRLALKEGRDDLAEAAAATQLDIEAQIPVIEKTIADCSERENELENYLKALHARKREMDAELDRVKQARAESVGEGAAAISTDGDGGNGQVNRRVEKANAAFDRMAKTITGAPGAAKDADPAKLAELEEMQRKNRVRERLEQFRKEAD